MPADAALRLAEFAPAKVNLALHVTGLREDGYHLIETLAVFARFGDRVAVASADADSFSVTGPFAADVPAGAGNLVLKARDALRHAVGKGAFPVAIALQKNLPAASGIGGGSADAAAALRALSRLWMVDPYVVRRIAPALGADVPMCLAGHPLVARGVGERIERVDGLPALPMLLVNPRIPVATADVFRRLKRKDGALLPDLPIHLDFKSVVDWLGRTGNDLQAPATAQAPVISDVLAAIERTGAAFARMSGSGATCYGLFRTAEAASAAEEEIRAGHPGWFVTSTVSGG